MAISLNSAKIESYVQARVQGGAQGACPPPPLEIEKQKKKRSSE